MTIESTECEYVHDVDAMRHRAVLTEQGSDQLQTSTHTSTGSISISFVALRPVGFLLDCEQYEQSSLHPPVLWDRGSSSRARERCNRMEAGWDVVSRGEDDSIVSTDVSSGEKGSARPSRACQLAVRCVLCSRVDVFQG